MSWNGFEFIDLFSGMGGFRIPFEDMGANCVFSSEIDKAARRTYELNFDDTPAGDIRGIRAGDIPNHDILLAGFPCQSFSIMGNRKGFADTRGTLFFEIERILQAKKPRMMLLENVPQLLTNDKGRTFEIIESQLKELGYHVHWTVLNALDFGLPQKRERVFIVGFRENYTFEFPNGGKKYDLGSVLEPDSDVPEKYRASEYIIKKRLAAVEGKRVFYPSVWHENKAGSIGIHNHACALRANASYNYQLVNGKRHFTPGEMLRFQGFHEEFEIFGSYTQMRSQTGNAVAVPVVRAVSEKMIEAVERGEIRKEWVQESLIPDDPPS